MVTVTDVSTTCAIVIFRVKVSFITSFDGIILIILSTDVIQLTLTVKMITALVVETSVTVNINNNNNSPIQGYVHPDDQNQTIFVYLVGLYLVYLFVYGL